MHNCHNCGSAITASFARVFGDRDGLVHGCPHCGEADGGTSTDAERTVEAIGGG